MRILLTGAGGFVGQVLVEKLLGAGHAVIAMDRSLSGFPKDNNLYKVEGDLIDKACIAKGFAQKPDAIIHLAALPGGAAEHDPELSFKVNVEATLGLMRKASTTGCRRFVYASTIAVIGDDMSPDGINDGSPLKPSLHYGIHKNMMEVALKGLTRRGDLDGIGLRLPGILARPSGASGMKSAFMSDLFHAVRNGEQIVLPMEQDSTIWAMSVDQCAENFVHAVSADINPNSDNAIMTLPAIYATLSELANAVVNHENADPALISYDPDLKLQAAFGSHPTLEAAAAKAVGFKNDGDLNGLVKRIFSRIG